MPSASPQPSRRFASPASRCARLVLFAALVLPCGAAWAQETTGAVEGTILGPDGKPLPDIVVVATMPATRITRSVVTGSDGEYRILLLPLGEYEVAIQDPGYQPVTVKPVLVRLGRTTAVPLVQLAPQGQLVEQVEVKGKPPIIDPVSTTAGGSLSSVVFDNLPVTRDYMSIAALLPNVSVSYLGDGVNIAGATGFENRYFIDGIDMTEGVLGSVGTSLPPDFIQEVQVKTAGYEAEYRSALGGVVNVVTPSGSNGLAGKFIGYWTSDLLSAERKQSSAALQQKDYSQYDLGFTLSGPIVRDRAWYFVAFDPEHREIETEIPGIGYFPDTTTALRYSGKVNWQINDSNNVALTVIGDPANRDGVGDLFGNWGTPASFLNPDPYLRDISTGGTGVSLRGTHVLAPIVLLETSLSGQWYEYSNLAATERGREELLFQDAETGVWSGGGSTPTDWDSRQYAASAKATFALGQHELKAGAEYRENKEDLNVLGADIITRYDDSFYFENAFRLWGSTGNRTATAFVQDGWRIGQRLALNVGVRWGQEEFADNDGQVVQTIDNEWQPRVGFVFLPGRIGTQRIYGSAARYYQELSTWPLAMTKMGQGTWRGCSYDHDPRLDPTGGDCIGIEFQAYPETPDLRGNWFDEYSLGYELQFSERHRGGIRALYRALGDTVEDAESKEGGTWISGNPGRGELSHYPRPSRVYEALELTLQGRPTDRSGYFASYVYSENRGNHPGLYNTDFGWPAPNAGGSFDYLFMMDEGLLPNDRPHVFKASGFYLFPFGLNVGGSILWQSGTPLNEFGGSDVGPPYYTFLQPRGTAGRTPSIFDMSLRFDYTFTGGSLGRWKPRLILDVYHLFSSATPVDYDQVHYFWMDENGNQSNPNPTYGMVTAYSPPTTARLGFEVSF